MNIGVITYNTNHLKTEQILLGWKYNGILDNNKVIVYALPFKERKKRNIIFNHRPNQSNASNIYDLCKYLGIELNIVEKDTDINGNCDIYIITGAGILSEDFVEGKKIINCHPGIIPTSRGLDSFKWSLYNGDKVGITLHYIDKEVDKGEIIYTVETPIFKDDTLDSFALRHYLTEINILINFIDYINNRINNFIDVIERDSTMRMPYQIEKDIEFYFNRYKEKYLV